MAAPIAALNLPLLFDAKLVLDLPSGCFAPTQPLLRVLVTAAGHWADILVRHSATDASELGVGVVAIAPHI